MQGELNLTAAWDLKLDYLNWECSATALCFEEIYLLLFITHFA